MSPKVISSLIMVLVVLFVGISSIFTVKEGQQAVVLRFGKMVLNAQGQPEVVEPGLHVKVPLIDQVRKFDVRLHTLDVATSNEYADARGAPRIMTAEQKEVIADYYVKWRINDLPLYYTRTGGGIEAQAEKLLRRQLDNALRAEFGRRTISEVVSDDRDDIMNSLRAEANKSAENLGLTVIDVRIKRIDLPEDVSGAVYARMRAEREQAARKIRSEGQADAEALRAQADAEALVTVATAQAEANTVRAQGDAVAAKIYADAYNKDKDFYAFYRSLLAYKSSFKNKQDFMLINPNSQFFKYFNDAKGQPVTKAKAANS